MSEGTLLAFQIVTSVFMVLGMLSMVTVIFPGLTVQLITALVYLLITGFTPASTIYFAVIALLAVGGMLVDNFIMGASASKTGATWWGIALSLAAGVVFSFLFPPFGGLAAAMLVMFAVEILRLRDLKRASKSTASILVGCGISALVRIGIAVVITALWFAWILTA